MYSYRRSSAVNIKIMFLLVALALVFTASVGEAAKNLTANKTGSTGTGTISSNPAGISCGASCTTQTNAFDNNATVILTAVADPGSVFTSWSGCSSTSGNQCTRAMENAARTVTAVFTLSATPTYAITVTQGANGTISPGTTTITQGNSQGFTITANAGYAISSVIVDGVSVGTPSSYTFSNVTATHTIAATFVVAPAYSISISSSGTGSGTVTSSSGGINCGSTCYATYASGTSVTLTATATAGSTFTNWSGACSGTSATCTVTVSGALSVNAVFTVDAAAACATPTPGATPTPTPTPTPASAAMQKYCSTPPFIPQTLRPNLLLMIDNSLSMYDPAYYSTTSYTSSAAGIYPGYDNSYTDSKTYVGYFDNTTLYKGNNGTAFVNDGNCSTFVAYTGAKTCSYINTSYLCISMDAGLTDVTEFIARGNFLNWLAISKMDVEKQVLTGGKYDSTYNILVGESRGWNGMRYIKSVTVPGANQVTFSVRGPNNGDYPDLGSSDGGTSRIDIFKGAFDASRCQEAIYQWLYGNMGQAKNATADCMPDSGYGGDKTLPTFNHTMQTCWSCGTPCTVGGSGGGTGIGTGDVSRVKNDCEGYYGTLSSAPPDYEDANKLAAVCATTGPGSLGSKSYVGSCWNGSAWSSTACIETGFVNYCNDTTSNPVTDPTGDALLTQGVNGSGTLPAILLDFGILSQLGDPLKTYQLRIEQSSTPMGLVHDFYDLIKFGIMTFNTKGSVTECIDNSTILPCPTSGTNLDGGKIISYIPQTDDKTVLNTLKQPFIDSINSITASTWTPYAEAFYNAIGYFSNRTDMRLNAADFDTAQNPVDYTCRQNNVLMVTDGVSTADRNPNVVSLAVPSAGTSLDSDDDDDNTCFLYSGSKYLDDLSWLAKNKNIFTFTKDGGGHLSTSAAPTKASQYISTYVVFNGQDNGLGGECSPVTLLSNTAANGGGSYQSASNAEALELALRNAFLSIAAKAASGTAASVLGEKSTEGYNVFQAVFYPSKLFNIASTPSSTKKLSWLGYTNSLWYYYDTSADISNIREDTVHDYKLNLQSDRVIAYTFTNDQLVVNQWSDTDGDGAPNTALADKSIDDVVPLWEAGKKLFQRSAASRTIYVNDSSSAYPKTITSTSCGSGNLVAFTTGNAGCFSSYFGTITGMTTNTLIDYIRGTDDNVSIYRDRTLPLYNPVDSATAGTWKLGDIVYSSPLIVKYTAAASNSDYSVLYVGANDGMLHAFKIGQLSSTGLTGFDKIQDTVGTIDSIALGEEMWAFVPKNILPYLRYYADPSYCHISMIDAAPYLISSGSKRILIGGMRLGAGCGGNSTVTPPTDTCADPYSTTCVGTSSYFALDVTNPKTPKLLWEFTDPKLKMTFSGPAVINRNSVKYVMFLSGPNDTTGTTNQNLNAFILKLNSDFTINTTTTIDLGSVYGSAYNNSFGGRLFTNGLDVNEDGNTDFVFFGYSKSLDNDSASGYPAWGGGVVKVYMGSSNPSSWVFDNQYVKFLTTNGFPVTAKIGVDQCFGKNYLYFGTGRYFFTTDKYGTSKTGGVDYTLKPDIIGGAPFMCTAGNVCSVSSVEFASVGAPANPTTEGNRQRSTPATTCTNLNNGDYTNAGWYLALNPMDSTYYQERATTDPSITGLNFTMFSTSQPATDICTFSGQSRMWGLNCATGAAITDNSSCTNKVVDITKVKGRLLVQLSTAAISQIDPSASFSSGTPYTPFIPGMNPDKPPAFVSPVKGNKILHWIIR